jgi:Acetyltransferase (GNAT) domain
MSSTKDRYREFCKIQSMPVFLQDWWLDAVCIAGTWDVAVVTKGPEIQAVMPYYIVKGRLGHPYITLPHLTQFMGPWLVYPDHQKYSSKLSHEKRLFSELIEQLPPFAQFTQSFHHSVGNWLPFYWRQFQQSTGYTYVLEDLSDLGHLFDHFKSNIRRQIRKAEKCVTVTQENDIEAFYHMVCKTYARQGKTFSQPFSFLKRIDAVCEQQQCRRIFFARGNDGQIHAALYLIWDEQSAYHLISGGDPDLRASGATSLLMWFAIKFAATVTKTYDFEGSMIQPIERFFSSFGAVQKPYLQLRKTNSRYIKLKQCLKGLI